LRGTGSDVENPVEHGTESSADEETSIVRRQSRQNGANSMNYQTTTPSLHNTYGSTGLRSKPSTTSIRRSGRVYDPGPRQREEEEEEHSLDETEGWWARLLSDYGSIELENKGSVARDHLALGMYSRSSAYLLSHKLLLHQLLTIHFCRTDVSRMATYFSSICFNWHSNYPALPSQYHNCCGQWLGSISASSTNGETSRSYVLGHQYFDVRRRFPSVFRESALDYTRKIPGK
jgi:hypothetical protein